MTLKFVKPFFARLLDPHVNRGPTKPTLGSNFVDWKKIEESKINILFEAGCEINKILQIGGEINNTSSSTTPPPVVIEWRPPNYLDANIFYFTQQRPHVKPMLAQYWSTVYDRTAVDYSAHSRVKKWDVFLDAHI